MPAGESDVEVRFDRMGSAAPAGGDRRHPSSNSHTRQNGDAVPPRLALAERLRFSPRTVILVTYDSERRALVTVRDLPTGR
jgi:hypothetical protein